MSLRASQSVSECRSIAEHRAEHSSVSQSVSERLRAEHSEQSTEQSTEHRTGTFTIDSQSVSERLRVSMHSRAFGAQEKTLCRITERLRAQRDESMSL